jgi:hypothetical protein
MIEAMYRYWDDHPPVHIVAAAFAGIKPKAKSKKPQTLEEFMAGARNLGVTNG